MSDGSYEAARALVAQDLILTRQRTIRRARLFTAVPAALLGVLLANLAWEIVRKNFTHVQFSVADSSTTFSLLAAGLGLLLTRAQWARSVRPTIGLGVDPDENRSRTTTSRWNLRLINAGPGTPTVEGFDYYVSFDSDEPPSAADFFDFFELGEKLRLYGWESDVDYWIKWVSPGAALPTSNDYRTAEPIGWFGVHQANEMQRFDMRIRVLDLAGDSHERVLPCATFIKAPNLHSYTRPVYEPRPLRNRMLVEATRRLRKWVAAARTWRGQ